MIKADLVAKIAEMEGMKKADVERVLNTLGTVASCELVVNGGEVPFPGIGKLKVSDRKARTGRNPRTGKAIDIPAKRAVTFTVAKALKDALK